MVGNWEIQATQIKNIELGELVSTFANIQEHYKSTISTKFVQIDQIIDL